MVRRLLGMGRRGSSTVLHQDKALDLLDISRLSNSNPLVHPASTGSVLPSRCLINNSSTRRQLAASRILPSLLHYKLPKHHPRSLHRADLPRCPPRPSRLARAAYHHLLQSTPNQLPLRPKLHPKRRRLKHRLHRRLRRGQAIEWPCHSQVLLQSSSIHEQHLLRHSLLLLSSLSPHRHRLLRQLQRLQLLQSLPLWLSLVSRNSPHQNISQSLHSLWC